MKSVTLITVTLIIHTLAYHDPDLNYHISQVQKLDCGDGGYSYPAPALQLTTTGIKYAQNVAQPLLAHSYQYSKDAGYAAKVAYQSVAPKATYAAQPAATYQAIISHGNYATASSYATQEQQKEFHGYATTAGLSSVGSTRTVIPQATYAQAPIIAKITAAPLVAKFATSPAKTTYVTQVAQQAAVSTGSLAKASLNSYNVQSGGPVVTQLFAAAPAARYATSPALRAQPIQQIVPARYTAVSAPITQYAQVQTPVTQVVPQYRAQVVTQHAATSGTQVPSPSVQYLAPVASQYSAPITRYTTQLTAQQYVAPAVAQYTAPALPQYTSPLVTKYAAPAAFTQYSAVAQHAAPVVAQYAKSGVSSVQYSSAPMVQQVSAPTLVAAPARVTVAPVKVKNVHTEFIENYDANPKYAYEYAVNDPHTGDIKHQKEERNGEVVKGQYSLVEPDGSVRTVHYVADWETGFHADVRNTRDNHN
ncbi:paternally-expressed gene 3 protein-like [Hyposmocoma kahamanoa]|uniref:paternally-expressed gene 3 protein-like n=1 Tax=Hyposmocoma kahamanoa TaxID=1477025 RepID=UPI000E6D9D50|nr:paternally-expressed gene 3 protein-like [Hyposmocoma kahamanoa]